MNNTISDLKNKIYDTEDKIKEYEYGIRDLSSTLELFKDKRKALIGYLDSLKIELSSSNITKEEYDNIELECNCGKIESGRHHSSCPSLKNKK